MKRRWMTPWAVFAIVVAFGSGTSAEEVFVEEAISLDALGIEVEAGAGGCSADCVLDYYVFSIAPGPNWSRVLKGETKDYSVPIPNLNWTDAQPGTLSMWIRDVNVGKTEMEWYKHHLDPFPVWSMWLPITCAGCTGYIDNQLLPASSTMLQSGNTAKLRFRNDSDTWGSDYKDVILVFPHCVCGGGCAGATVAEASTGPGPEARNLSGPAGLVCLLLLPSALAFLMRRRSAGRRPWDG